MIIINIPKIQNVVLSVDVPPRYFISFKVNGWFLFSFSLFNSFVFLFFFLFSLLQVALRVAQNVCRVVCETGLANSDGLYTYDTLKRYQQQQ